VQILVTFALDNEFAPWRGLREFRPGKWGDADAYWAEMGGAEVGVLLTGTGPRRAAAAVGKVFRSGNGSIHCCISSGLAGALRAEYQVGQTLAARAVFSETVPDDYTSSVTESSEALISFAAECGATVVDRFYSARRVVARALDKKHLGAAADAVEMESFEILRQAQDCGIPAVAIRAVSDAADEDLPLDMNEVFSKEGQLNIPRVLGQVARHPYSLPGLWKLGQQSKRAAESLAQFLDRYVVAVAERARALEAKAAAAVQ
jgi:adenosylhomocysteine nucleosidase